MVGMVANNGQALAGLVPAEINTRFWLLPQHHGTAWLANAPRPMWSRLTTLLTMGQAYLMVGMVTLTSGLHGLQMLHIPRGPPPV